MILGINGKIIIKFKKRHKIKCQHSLFLPIMPNLSMGRTISENHWVKQNYCKFFKKHIKVEMHRFVRSLNKSKDLGSK